MVRLKHNFEYKNIVEIEKSQFHYGSIKTLSLCTIISKKLKSQFHYGSIKTQYAQASVEY